MKRLSLVLAAAGVLSSGFLGASNRLNAAPIAPPAASLVAVVPNTAKPAPRNEKWWTDRHEQYTALAKKGGIDLYFAGDSITDGWHNNKAIWNKEFGAWKPGNFGIGGDQTQHVLWRLQNGEFEGVKPKVVVLMIGTNSIGDKVENIAAGVAADVKEIQTQSPATKILLLAIFPRGEKADDPVRAKVKQVNEIIAKLDNGKTIKYLDIGTKLCEPDGSLSAAVMYDKARLHPAAKGYQIWADAIKPQLTEWLGAPAN